MSSFFKKPSWAKSDPETTGTDFYRRSQHVYSDIVSGEDDGTDTSPAGERTAASEIEERRPSSQVATNEEAFSESVPSKFQKPDAQNPISPHPRNAGQHCSSTAISSDQVFTRVPNSTSSEVDLTELHSTAGSDDISSEEEFPELARKAREKARRTLFSGTGSVGSPPTHPLPTTHPLIPSIPSTGPLSATPVEDPVVQILITSKIKNTKPLVIHRRLTQSLGDVRKAWCDTQGFSLRTASSVFLTWRRKRLFDVTTCKSLGIQDFACDSLFLPSTLSSESAGLRVHMEAVTDELFGSQEPPKDSDPQEYELQHSNPESMNDTSLRIILRSPNLKDFKLRVRPRTQCSFVLKSFCTAREVDTRKTVELHFDGSRLNPDSSIEENDIDDLDCIDVVIKS